MFASCVKEIVRELREIRLFASLASEHHDPPQGVSDSSPNRGIRGTPSLARDDRHLR